MRRYTDEQLAAALPASGTMRQLLSALGLTPRGGNYETVRRRIVALGLDASHLPTSAPRRLVGHIDAALLAKAVESSTSVIGVIRLLGLPETNAARRRVVAGILAGPLDASHFRGHGWARGERLGRRHEIARYLVVGPPRIKTSELRRRLVDEGLLARCCAGCGLREWLGRSIPLELDHINGHRDDNRLVNLRLLCPNCHALTPTYRGRNVGRYARLVDTGSPAPP